MWLLLAMIMIMPYEASPYLYLAENLLGVFPDFTVIKALGLLGLAWAGLRLAAGDPAGRLLTCGINPRAAYNQQRPARRYRHDPYAPY